MNPADASGSHDGEGAGDNDSYIGDRIPALYGGVRGNLLRHNKWSLIQMHAYRSQPPPSTVSVTTFPRPASGSESTSRSTLRRALDSSRVWERRPDKDGYSRAIVEAVGTFALIFVGAGSIVATGGQNLVAIALAHGLAIGLMVAAAGQISGGLYNPALAVGLISARRMPLSRGIY